MKRFHFVILIVFVISAVLLGLSYSKDTGQYGVPEIGQIIDNKYRVIFSTSDYLTNKNLSTDIGLVNKSSEILTYVIKLIPEIGENIQYSVNGKEYKELIDRNVLESKVNSFGKDGDYVLNSVAIKCNGECRVKVEIKTIDKEFLKDIIKKSENVYDDNGILRYYGEFVNNYISYQNDIYRIYKIQGYQTYLISEPRIIGRYKVDGGKYLELADYLASFKEGAILESEILANKSWITTDQVFWLESDNYLACNLDKGIVVSKARDVHYIRPVIVIDGSNLVITKGDGSLVNPYEVSYGSK